MAISMPASSSERPVGRALLETLDDFAATTQKLLAALSTGPSHRTTTAASTSAPHIARLIELDGELDRLSRVADRHIANQTRIQSLVAELREHDRVWREDMREAERSRRSLDVLVERGRRDREAIERASKATLTADAVLSLGRRLAPFTSLPPHAFPTNGAALDLRLLTQQPGVQLPWPTEDMLKRGWLGQAEGADQLEAQAGLGETRDAGLEAKPAPEMPVRAPTRTKAIARPPPVVDVANDYGDIDLDLNPDSD